MLLVFVGFNGLTPHFVDDCRILLGCVWTFAELCCDCIGFWILLGFAQITPAQCAGKFCGIWMEMHWDCYGF